jgi:hypothetical protein
MLCFLTHLNSSFWTIFFLITYLARTNIQFPVVDCWPAIAGISFVMINVRTSLKLANGVPTVQTSVPTVGSLGSFIGPRSEPSIPLQQLNISITQDITQDNGDQQRKGKLL